MVALSVVIPVYNVEKYLRECLDSCLAQEGVDLELVCVDDGSTDGSGKILAEYVRRDSRVRVLSFEKNRGLFSARRHGVLSATGAYVLNVDSDDRLVGSDGLQRVVRAMEDCRADMMIYGVRAFSHIAGDVGAERRAEAFNRAFSWENRKDIPADDYAKAVFEGRTALCGIWGKLFRTECLKAAYAALPDGYCQMAEDGLALLTFLGSPRKIASSSECLYDYRIGSGMSTDGRVTLEKRRSILRSLAHVSRCLRTVPPCRDNRCAPDFRRWLLEDVLKATVCGCVKEDLADLIGDVPLFAEEDRAAVANVLLGELESRVPRVDHMTGRLMLVGLAVGRLVRKVMCRDVCDLSLVRRHVKEMMHGSQGQP